MPATARQIERHYTEPPDDAPEQTCPECDGECSVIHGAVAIPCAHCQGTGTIPYEPDPDRAYDAMVDREMEARA